MYFRDKYFSYMSGLDVEEFVDELWRLIDLNSRLSDEAYGMLDEALFNIKFKELRK